MTPDGAKTEEIITTYRKNLWSVFFKRFFDIVLSLLGLIILSPLFIVVSLIVFFKLDRKVFFSTYRSYRIGRNNKVFKLLKFSTMKNNLFDENGNLLPDKDRVSKFGNFLRKTSIDELPQLINILKGDMSLIGPRPRIIEECVFLDEDSLRVRGLVRPGITGLAQINGRNNIIFTKVVEYDKQYIKTIGFWTDLKIFFKTIGKVLKKSDINKDGTVSNEFFGDMLLRTGEISQEEYDKKQIEAREIINKAQSKQPKQA
ncbi:MAG: sugar transferase [Clostridia bacterium]|nr:sugar transferase [Clostridia bacterium]